MLNFLENPRVYGSLPSHESILTCKHKWKINNIEIKKKITKDYNKHKL